MKKLAKVTPKKSTTVKYASRPVLFRKIGGATPQKTPIKKTVDMGDVVRLKRIIMGADKPDVNYLASLGIEGRAPNMGDITRIKRLILGM